MLFALCLASAACAAMPAVLTLINLREYLPPLAAGNALLPRVAVLIPARNEEEGIEACLNSVLRSTGVELEVIVLDDASTDRTGAIVARIAAQDARVRLLGSAALPDGWNGKQHACWQAAQAAMAPVLCFLDADVRLQPEALARTAAVLQQENAGLVSGFPQEVTGTWMEKLLIPLIHFILLGLLPIRKLHATTTPGFAAGCGQYLLADRAAYFRAGGHAAIRQTMHDGLLLPRLFRQHGFRTRLVDLTDFASCRMYHSAATTWNGLAKNATEGLAQPVRIVPMTLFLGVGQVLPLLLLWLAWQRTIVIIPFLGPSFRTGMAAVWVAAFAAFCSYLPRVVNAIRYRQSWLGTVLHPISVALLLVLQWYALLRKLSGRPAAWKSRTYQAN
ncbi:MAG: glycosyltransferase family 2 protein [Janthinobacterium lividum]